MNNLKQNNYLIIENLNELINIYSVYDLLLKLINLLMLIHN